MGSGLGGKTITPTHPLVPPFSCSCSLSVPHAHLLPHPYLYYCTTLHRSSVRLFFASAIPLWCLLAWTVAPHAKTCLCLDQRQAEHPHRRGGRKVGGGWGGGEKKDETRGIGLVAGRVSYFCLFLRRFEGGMHVLWPDGLSKPSCTPQQRRLCTSRRRNGKTTTKNNKKNNGI